mmetsp:Transcript_29197/g.48242  ORF Transcript_29197/g.48242 Transcript_29197/m.48242 type:complete len:242 (-) Transcript_29197:11-736(-)
MAAEQVVVADEWIELKEPKQFSRLLYTNPVCFLSTANSEQRNVMVLSWLTATNNEGRFMFSLNRKRHTASLISEGCTFVLSVPVKGMEELVKEVGGTPGRWGSKFADDHPLSEQKEEAAAEEEAKHLSKRQKKKQQFSRRWPVVAGLKAVPLGHQPIQNMDSSKPSAVDGTVAHLQCKAYSKMQEGVIDEDHYLILAEVTQAFVKSSYWDGEKKLFRPSDISVPPYLTFFGSQTFGYVSTS